MGPVESEKADVLPDDLIAQAWEQGVIFAGMRHDVEDIYLGLDI